MKRIFNYFFINVVIVSEGLIFCVQLRPVNVA